MISCQTQIGSLVCVSLWPTLRALNHHRDQGRNSTWKYSQKSKRKRIPGTWQWYVRRRVGEVGEVVAQAEGRLLIGCLLLLTLPLLRLHSLATPIYPSSDNLLSSSNGYLCFVARLFGHFRFFFRFFDPVLQFIPPPTWSLPLTTGYSLILQNRSTLRDRSWKWNPFHDRLDRYL